MRTISESALTKLKTTHGIEPICIVEIDWVDGSTYSYSDRTVDTIPGRIVELGDMDDVASISGSTGTQEITLTLDDTDGTIKTIMNAHDVHKRPARVYQYFSGLSLSDKFLLFAGVITTPVEWREQDRTVKLTILSYLEDKELGFSAEEAGFDYLPAALVGKAWPMIFGSVVNNPAVEIVTAISGTTLSPVGILAGEDLMLSLSDCGGAETIIQLVHNAYDKEFKAELVDYFTYMYQDATTKAGEATDSTERAAYKAAATKWLSIGNSYLSDYNTELKSYASELAAYNDAIACVKKRRQKKIDTANINGVGDNPIIILGGEDFPQDTEITITIDGGHFTGIMHGTKFTYTSSSNEELVEKAQGKYNAKLLDTDVCGQNNTTLKRRWVWSAEAPTDSLDSKESTQYTKVIDYSFTLSELSVADREPVIQQFWVEPGATASVYTGEEKIHIVSITPGTVKAVRAFKQTSSNTTRLVDVPSDLYTVQSSAYGTITAVEIHLAKPLSHIIDEGWQDQLYVTFESTVGPNIVDIIRYIVENYSTLSCDATSFASVKTALTNFPANFPINTKRNVMAVLQEIAFQARCALWVTNNVVFLKYLPVEPTVDDTITESDILADQGISVELTPTEDIVTKIVANWHLRYANVTGTVTTMSYAGQGHSAYSGFSEVSTQSYDAGTAKDNNFQILLRHNIKKYGVHEAAYDFYIYNQPDIVYKVATFWLIRKSSTWKRIKFSTPLHKLRLETFDAVTLDFDIPYVADSAVTAIVESAKYDSANNCVHFQCLTPVLSGSMKKNKFFWPATLSQSDTWPPQEDIDSGNAGGANIGANANGTLAVGDTSTITNTVFVGGMNIVFGANSDRGDSTPTDAGFVPQSTFIDNYSSSATKKTDLNLTVDYADKVVVSNPALVDYYKNYKGNTVLNVNTTTITDGAHIAPLSSVFKRVRESKVVLNNELVVSDETVTVTDGVSKVADSDTGHRATFTFKYDSDSEQFGAKIAFLEEEGD